MSKGFKIHHLPPPHKALKLIVTIPVKNEAEFIIPTLQALAQQDLSTESATCFEVIVLINHSSDDTLKKCRNFQLNNPTFQLHILVTYAPDICNVGAARKVMMDLAATRLTHTHHIIAMTDADTRVSKDWISKLLQYILKPVDFICGSIRVNCTYLNPFAQMMFDAKECYLLYRAQLEASLMPETHDPWPQHAANSGPNMAIKKGAYLKIGGMPALECLEDSAFHQRAVHHGLRVRHDPEIQVETSARLHSRVTRGFGEELNFWSQLTDSSYVYAVEGLQKMQLRLAAYALVKEAYLEQLGRFDEIANLLKFPDHAISTIFNAQPNYQAMNQRLFTVLEKHKPWQAAYPNISVLEANEQLEAFFAKETSAIAYSFPKELVQIPAE